MTKLKDDIIHLKNLFLAEWVEFKRKEATLEANLEKKLQSARDRAFEAINLYKKFADFKVEVIKATFSLAHIGFKKCKKVIKKLLLDFDPSLLVHKHFSLRIMEEVFDVVVKASTLVALAFLGEVEIISSTLAHVKPEADPPTEVKAKATPPHVKLNP